MIRLLSELRNRDNFNYTLIDQVNCPKPASSDSKKHESHYIHTDIPGRHRNPLGRKISKHCILCDCQGSEENSPEQYHRSTDRHSPPITEPYTIPTYIRQASQSFSLRFLDTIQNQIKELIMQTKQIIVGISIVVTFLCIRGFENLRVQNSLQRRSYYAHDYSKFL